MFIFTELFSTRISVMNIFLIIFETHKVYLAFSPSSFSNTKLIVSYICAKIYVFKTTLIISHICANIYVLAVCT